MKSVSSQHTFRVLVVLAQVELDVRIVCPQLHRLFDHNVNRTCTIPSERAPTETISLNEEEKNIHNK